MTIRPISRHANIRLPHAQQSHLDQVQPASNPVARCEGLPVLVEFPVRLHARAAEAVAVGVRTKVKAGALRRPAESAEVSEVHLHLNDVECSTP